MHSLANAVITVEKDVVVVVFRFSHIAVLHAYRTSWQSSYLLVPSFSIQGDTIT